MKEKEQDQPEDNYLTYVIDGNGQSGFRLPDWLDRVVGLPNPKSSIHRLLDDVSKRSQKYPGLSSPKVKKGPSPEVTEITPQDIEDNLSRLNNSSENR